MKKKIKGDNCCIFLMGDNFYMIINGKLILKIVFFLLWGVIVSQERSLLILVYIVIQ